jgi:hypothetical protein
MNESIQWNNIKKEHEHTVLVLLIQKMCFAVFVCRRGSQKVIRTAHNLLIIQPKFTQHVL